MSKILRATCSPAGIVSAEGVEVPVAQVLSEGNQQSSGLLFMDEDEATYLPSSASDIKTTIEKVITALDNLALALTQVATTLTSIGAGMTGPTTAPPGTLATDIVNLTAKVTAVNATKAELNTLKEALK